MKIRFTTRRATLDDLGQLHELWRLSQFPAADLEKQFTDFLVVEDSEGRVAAAIAFRIIGHEALIHSESFADFAMVDTLRPLLWERIERVAATNSLFRLWTRETAPFWRNYAGFGEPAADILGTIPEGFGPPGAGWFTMLLKEPTAAPEALEAQIQRFKQEEEAKREAIYARARMLRIVGTGLALAIFVYGMILLLKAAKHR